MNQIFNFPNILSIARIFLAYPIIYFLGKNETINAVWLILIAIFTDYFDGYFSRKNKEVTEFGKFIDPVADKICVISILLFLFFQNKIELYYFLIIFTRDFVIMIGGLHLKIKKGFIIKSNWVGKVTVFFTSIYILLVVLNFGLENNFVKIIYYTNILYLFYSLFLYIKRYFEVLRGELV